MTDVTRADVVIVGGGLLGLATAYALRGTRDVIVLERGTIGHERGGSHGATRIFRLGYADPPYVERAQRAAGHWHALEAASGATLLHPTPQLTFGPGAEAVWTALRAAGAPVERLAAADVAARFPAFAAHGDAVLEPASAVIDAARTLRVLRDGARADVREHARVESVAANRVETATERFEARTVVVCAGPWTRALVPGIDTTPTLEHVAYLAADPALPIFIDFTEPAVYGLPTPGSDRYKLAIHHGGSVVDLERDFLPDPAAVAALREAAGRWLPTAPIVEIDVCPYDDTRDEDFVIARVDGIVVGAGTSGHAFKFGPLLGTQLAELVQKED